MPNLPTANASREAIEAARMRTAMQSKPHMKEWMQASGRRWLVIDAFDMIESIWTGKTAVFTQQFQDLLALYCNYRRRIPNGKFEEQEDPMTGRKVQIALSKDEILEPEEMDRAIRYMVAQIREHIPDWSLEKPAL